MQLTIKAQLEEDLRRTTISKTPNFNELQSILETLFSVPASQFSIKYLDDDQDHISMSSELELKEALSFVNQTQRPTLRLFLKLKEKERTPKENSVSILDKESTAKETSDLENLSQLLRLVLERLSQKAGSAHQQAESPNYGKTGGFRVKGTKARVRHTPSAPYRETAGHRTFETRFVRDTFPDGSILLMNSKFTKTWVLRNEGSEEWPAGLVLSFVYGDKMSSVTSVPVQTIPPGGLVEISVPMVAPSKPGRYVSYWRLTYPQFHFDRKYLYQVWVDIIVSDKLNVGNLVEQKRTKEDQ
jgi:hypothetical protein